MTHLSSPPSTNGLGLSSNDAISSSMNATSAPPTNATDERGRVAYGPGFYVPPPGYPASTFVLNNVMAKVDEMVEIEIQAASSKQGATDTPDHSLEAVGFATLPLRQNSATRSRPAAQTQRRRTQDCCYHDKRSRTSAPSTYGTFVIWSLLAVLLAASQSMLLSTYERKQKAALIALGFAAVHLHLFAALLSTFGLLIATSLNPVDRAYLEQKVKRRRKRSCMVSVANSMPNVAGMLVCLGATLQLSSVAVFALQSKEQSTIWSVVTAIVLSLLVALTAIARQLYLDDHLQLTPSRNRKSSSTDTEAGSRLPLSSPRPPSRSSSMSSHSGKYIPDYGLDCDSESDDYGADVQHARADWTDRVLDGLIHSPLLDESRTHR